MDHTLNYRLPQWEKSDRILMDDFNQMCASLEAGLSENKSAADSLAVQIAQVDQDARARDSSNSASALSSLKTGLFRNAYNRYHAASALDPLPRQLGFRCQKFSPELCGSAGFESLIPKTPDAAWLACGAENRSYVDLAPFCSKISDLAIDYGNLPNAPAVFDFTPDGPGYVYDILLMGSWPNNPPPAAAPKFRVTLENLDTNKIEINSEITGTYHTDIPTAVWLYGKFYFHQCRYRVTVAPVNTNYSAYFNILNQGLFRGVTYRSPSATLSQTVPVGETSIDGFVSLVFDRYGDVGIQLKWDGKTIAPYCTYSYADPTGRDVQELLWRRGAAVPASTTIQLELNCSEGSDISLYSWGMALI